MARPRRQQADGGQRGRLHPHRQQRPYVRRDGRNTGAFVEWKVPSFAFTDRKTQEGYFEEATNIIHEMSGRRQPRDRIFINVVHAVDGAWNFNGKAMTNAEIGAEVANAG